MQGYTAAVDFALAIFPWFILWQLNMKRKERLTIAFGLSLGIFSSAPYELGDAPSQQLGTSTKVDTNQSQLKQAVKGRRRSAYDPHSSETSTRTLTGAAHENHSDENFILNEAVGRSDLAFGNGIYKKTEVEVTYK
ncbi:hypothetical protein SLS60_012067 [Paraconiothyrium brasiliense]|uniref:Uncharacterized protein n=1 Tax=Paraconiothyrium brasiliense TaxID=300254 RepID=A0ABR3QGV3_9PLEO